MITTPKAGFLLAASCVAAIAAVGSIFELSSGHPQYGVWFTGIVLTLSVPLGGFFFFAAVREAKENQ
ncbi:MAG: hypothetical protein J7641_22725 [Cyanobacteria bacterium SID2]|nr:hypothetical protein [Cyanobacteria bacterium SID2]MBP0005231.1 hypothetical protein [Cyanobacteria bacterium SBC]